MCCLRLRQQLNFDFHSIIMSQMFRQKCVAMPCGKSVNFVIDFWVVKADLLSAHIYPCTQKG